VSEAETLLDPFTKLLHILVHEAGHTVVAWRSPIVLDVRDVRIDVEKREAECRFQTRDSRDSGDHLERAIIAMAGAAAEDICFGSFSAPISAQDLGNAVDRARWARRLGAYWRERTRLTPFLARVSAYVPPDCRVFVQTAFDLARKRLVENQTDLDRLYTFLIAAHLDGRTSSSGDEVATVLGPRPATAMVMEGV
jgi:hypothetical protein